MSNVVSHTCLLILLILASCTNRPTASQEVGWPAYGGDPGGKKYSALDQINRSNVGQLQVAWSYRIGEPKRPHFDADNTLVAAFECTPLVVDGVLYLSTPASRVVALQAETGKELWSFDPQQGKTDDRIYRQSRGVSFWRGEVEGKEQRRILLATGDARLIALDADSGLPCPGFGQEGQVDLFTGVGDRWPGTIYSITSPPAIYRNTVVAGSRLSAAGKAQGPSGKVRAFDVISGRQVWEFHTVPLPGEPGNETWEGDSWKDRSGANAWSIISTDVERGWFFVPTASPLGPDRKGQNLFGNSLVVLEAETGKTVWYYQMVHHDLWDYDHAGTACLADPQPGW